MATKKTVAPAVAPDTTSFDHEMAAHELRIANLETSLMKSREFARAMMAAMKMQDTRLQALEARLALAVATPATVAPAAPVKIGTPDQWQAAVAVLRAQNVRGAGPRGLYDAPSQVHPVMKQLFPELNAAPAAPVLETRAPIATAVPEAPVATQALSPEEAMF